MVVVTSRPNMVKSTLRILRVMCSNVMVTDDLSNEGILSTV